MSSAKSQARAHSVADAYPTWLGSADRLPQPSLKDQLRGIAIYCVLYR